MSRPTPRNRAERLGERLRSRRGRRPRKRRTPPPSVLPRRGRSQAARALSSPPFSHASPVLRPENSRAEELAVARGTDPLGPPAASAGAAPPNGEEDVRPAFQAAPDRGLGSGEDLRPVPFLGRCLQYHLYFHHRNRL